MYTLGKSLNLDVWRLCKEIQAIRKFMSVTILDCLLKRRRRRRRRTRRRRRRRQIAALEISAQSQRQQFCLWGRIGAAVIIQHHSSPPLLPPGFRLYPLRDWEFTTHPSSLYLRAPRMLVISGAQSTITALTELALDFYAIQAQKTFSTKMRCLRGDLSAMWFLITGTRALLINLA